MSQNKKTNCLVCNHVLNLERPILYTTHDDDGTWKFICRPIGHKITDIKTLPLHVVSTLDSSINELHEMPPGVGAKRVGPNTAWEPFLLYPDTEE